MPEVHRITFEGTIDLSDAGLNRLPSFPNLRELDFRGEAALSDDNIHVLTACQNLESLELKSSNVTDAGLASVAAIPRLRKFRHMGQFSSSALQQLQEKIPDCTISEVGWYD